MELAYLLPIVAFIALAAGLAVVFRRTGRLVARAREEERFRSSVRDLVTRIDVSLSGAASRIDAVRRHQLEPQALMVTLEAASDAVDKYTDEARNLGSPRDAKAIKADLVADLERAGRALAMVEHGAGILVAVRRGDRELEAQTSIKRGYLNLVHAREAIAAHVVRADELARDAADRVAAARRST